MDFSIVVLVLLGLVILAVLFKLILVLLPLAVVFAFSFIPLALMVAGLVSCIRSSKERNIKLLWILIIILAPCLGPLLWFFWGRKST